MIGHEKVARFRSVALIQKLIQYPDAERMYHHRRCCKWLPPASIQSCARLIMLRYTRCNIVILVAATAWLMLSFSSCFVCGFDSYTVLFKCMQRNFLWWHLKSTVYESNPHTIQELKDNISHAVAAIKITMLHRVYLSMVTARLVTNCSNTLRNIHTNARENITRTRAKRKAGYIFVAHPVVSIILLVSLKSWSPIHSIRQKPKLSPNKICLCLTVFVQFLVRR